jgi:hypothetical protein
MRQRIIARNRYSASISEVRSLEEGVTWTIWTEH